ncbi:uncharacterized protein LOC123538130 [Mercenaria mercenaria]|uniref:uncharacterized protein LOC123538130 n=1 Tax=Mercenaria mercenaria TaxID=6596 RepID=UPI00234F1D4F|nr:uncharacterized protein LOC123538130 [Mercenaria mercenaria]XP_045178041.2 uncharacterized protein LOC123538130 [Mercenaria mercenaria]
MTNTDKETFEELDLVKLLPDNYRNLKGNEVIKPSDVNKGFEDDQLLITFTGKDFSFAVACKLEKKNESFVLIPVFPPVKISNRTRSVIAIDSDHVCATTEYYVIIKRKDDDTDTDVKSHPRVKRDRGGLLMADGQGRFYYGDGDCFVGCHWDGTQISEEFRVSDRRMKFPQGSAIASSGRILVCCDSSHTIYSISCDGKDFKVVHFDGEKWFGDIDFNSSGKQFFTSFWHDNKWPVLFKYEA